MSLIFFLKPHYRGGGGDSGIGGRTTVYDDRVYEKVQPKKKVNPADIHPFFRDRPELLPLAREYLDQGFELDDILLLFMMTER